jgi:purine-binding chemotaxis protein CheW
MSMLTKENTRTFEERLKQFFYSADESDVDASVDNQSVEIEMRAEEIPEEFLAFTLARETYAIPIAAAREILKPGHITPIPHAPSNVLGLVNVRGEMLPLYDLKPRLRLKTEGVHQLSRFSRILLVKDLEGDVAILGVVKLPLSKLEATPPMGFERDVIAGLARHEGKLYILLDVAEALS